MIFHPMDFLIFLAFGLSIWAQFKVSSNFKKWSEVPVSSGMTGFEAARRYLDDNGLQDVAIELTPGKLSDHYDPTARVIRLSEDVYHGTTIAALSVACHEVGHAIQHKESYGFLTLRHRIFPVARFSSGIAPLLLIGGLLLQATSLIGIGIVLFSAAVFFQLITLPVEFNASSRAKDAMISQGFIVNEEERGVNKVLGAAALTYVAATLISLFELLKFIMIFTQSGDE